MSTHIEQTWLGCMVAGKRNFQQRKLGDAANAFSAATRLLPERAEGWVNLGSTLFEAGHYESATAALHEAVALRPKLMVAHLLLGDALRMLGQWRAASARYRHAVALQRTPISLNKLGCALRAEGNPELAEGLYREALAMEPGFTLARVNLATVQIELHHFDRAEQQLGELAQLSLPPVERREVEFAQLAVAEYKRLAKALTDLTECNNPAPLETALRHASRRGMQTDVGLLEPLRRYAASARHLADELVAIDSRLPEEWPLIEAMFMIPLVNSVDEYQAVKAQLKKGLEPSFELLQSVNMEAAIKATRACQFDMSDPIKAELHLRHWHALACDKLDGFQPGHFKYTQNWVAAWPTARRVEPALASATFQQFISEIYNALPAGYARAAVMYMALLDLHVFADGNARIALAWLNRELEWAGLMPAILPNNWGLNGTLGAVLTEVRENGDIAPVIAVLRRAQQYAQQFCAELSAR